ncbi:MAG: putative DNA binding domain-containing protein [Deltaproteobacteria bacterium]|jgi:ATP-dependent DNA helicase RecG|nr:putative DNA binding domain-containing protein [Deltaproteobacteria bacterium]
MDQIKFQTVLEIGETIAVEFKRCSGGIGIDTFKTVCSFLNRFGGDIYLGVEDNGTVCGIPENETAKIIKNFITMTVNPEVISPTVCLSPEIFDYNDKKIIHVYVPPSSDVHSFKKTIYDRIDDADVKVTSTDLIASMYIRKQNFYTERKVYQYISNEDLRIDLLPLVRQMAINHDINHPWKSMTDTQLLQSAGLISKDWSINKVGFNLASILLLGRDDVIKSIVPVYRTDAIKRKINVNRYDDRLIVDTNLIDSYRLLMDFASKNLLDKFYLEEDVRINLRSGITREMLVNSLIHREYTSSYISKFVIENEQMFTENASRAKFIGSINLDNFEPIPKNPLIASFFRNIGLADELGSGVKKLYHYVRRYSGQDPQLIEGDIFRIIVPLDDNYSFDVGISSRRVHSGAIYGKPGEALSGITGAEVSGKPGEAFSGINRAEVSGRPGGEPSGKPGEAFSGINRAEVSGKPSGKPGEAFSGINRAEVSEIRQRIMAKMLNNSFVSAKEIANELKIDRRNVESHIRALKKFGLIKREGSKRYGKWVVVS